MKNAKNKQMHKMNIENIVTSNWLHSQRNLSTIVALYGMHNFASS